MKHQHFDVGTAGFYGAYWACAGGSDCAVIAMIGDDPEDRLARSAVKWLCGRGVNVLTMSPAKKDYGHHNYPLERVEMAISWLKANGNHKIGIAGASTTGTLALTAAAMFPEITLTIAMTPSDFVWQGFMQGKKDGCKEWPVEGESLFSYAGKPLPYMPFCYQHPDYWHCVTAESKRTSDMVNSRKLFDDSEAEMAISWLKANGNHKIGIAGASTTGTLALTAAAMFPDLTLTIAMTPSDFVWQGFMQGKRDGCKEWPVEGESLFSYRGKPLPYMPFCYQHPDYWHCVAAESKRTGDMVNSRKLFDDSEAAHPIEPEEYIPVENIRGKLLLIGAEDDALWDTAKYIRRMEKRLAEKPHECEIETMVYAHGTHFVFPEGMLKTMLPVGSGLFVQLAFQAAKKYPKECRQTRIDIEKRMCRTLAEWKGEK